MIKEYRFPLEYAFFDLEVVLANVNTGNCSSREFERMQHHTPKI